MQIERFSGRHTLVMANGAQVTGLLDMMGAAVLTAYIPSGFTGGLTLTFEATPDEGSTWFPAYDAAGALLSITIVAGRAYSLPAALGAFRHIRLKVNTVTSREETIYAEMKG